MGRGELEQGRAKGWRRGKVIRNNITIKCMSHWADEPIRKEKKWKPYSICSSRRLKDHSILTLITRTSSLSIILSVHTLTFIKGRKGEAKGENGPCSFFSQVEMKRRRGKWLPKGGKESYIVLSLLKWNKGRRGDQRGEKGTLWRAFSLLELNKGMGSGD